MNEKVKAWQAYAACEENNKRVRVTLKTGEVYEGRICYFTDGYPGETEDTFLLSGPKGTDLRKIGDMEQSLYDSIIADIEILDGE